MRYYKFEFDVSEYSKGPGALYRVIFKSGRCVTDAAWLQTSVQSLNFEFDRIIVLIQYSFE